MQEDAGSSEGFYFLESARSYLLADWNNPVSRDT